MISLKLHWAAGLGAPARLAQIRDSATSWEEAELKKAFDAAMESGL